MPGYKTAADIDRFCITNTGNVSPTNQTRGGETEKTRYFSDYIPRVTKTRTVCSLSFHKSGKFVTWIH